MAYAVVQSNSGDTGTGTPASVDVTMASATTAGNKVIIVVSCDATVSTPTNFTLDRSQVNNNGHYVFSKTAIAETASWTLTPSSGASMAWVAYEISGLTTDAADQVQSAGTSSAVDEISTGTTGTTSQADELIIGTVGQSKPYVNGAVLDIDSWSNSFVQQDWDASTKTTATNVGVFVAFFTASSTATFETTGEWNAQASMAATGIIVTYAIAAGTEPETVIRPIADTAGTGWDTAPTASQALYAQVDEETPSDTDYIYATDPNP